MLLILAFHSPYHSKFERKKHIFKKPFFYMPITTISTVNFTKKIDSLLITFLS